MLAVYLLVYYVVNILFVYSDVYFNFKICSKMILIFHKQLKWILNTFFVKYSLELQKSDEN